MGLGGDGGVFVLLTCLRGWLYGDPEVKLLAWGFAFDFGMVHCHYLVRPDRVPWGHRMAEDGERGAGESGGLSGCGLPFLTDNVPWPFPLAVTEKASFCLVCTESGGEKRGC